MSSSETIVGERFKLDPKIVRAVRVNVEYTGANELPKDLEWKPTGNMQAKSDRYKDVPKGIPLWQAFGGDRGDLINVSLANLVVGLINNGLNPVKAYNEKRTGREGQKPKFRTTYNYMFPEMYEHRPEIMAILPKMQELRDRTEKKARSHRRENVWGHFYAYVNRVYEDGANGELVDTGHINLDLTAIYRNPLVLPNGKPNVIHGVKLEQLFSLEVHDGDVCLHQTREFTRAEAYKHAKELSWIIGNDAFELD